MGEIACDHPSTTANWEHVTCNHCGAVRTGAAGWTIAGCRWFNSLAEAKFYEQHGRLPEPSPSPLAAEGKSEGADA